MSVNSGYFILSPYSNQNSPWNVAYSTESLYGNKHYWGWSLDCSIIYRGTNNTDDEDESETRAYKYVNDLNEYEGNFYSSKIFLDGELIYDTYYSKDQYDYLKNNKNTLNLKYFTIGRCSMNGDGYWHYAKMNVYTMRLYTRGLTEDEIIENYNTTKAYYSIITGE